MTEALTVNADQPWRRVLLGASRLVWDFDGVIADTEPVQQAAYEAVLARHDVHVRPGWFTQWIGNPEHVVWAGLAEEHRTLRHQTDNLIGERRGVYRDMAKLIEPAWFVPALLALPLQHVVVSAGNHDDIVWLLDHWGIASGFDDVRATRKRTSQGTKEVRLRKAITESKCVVVEDSVRYLRAARVAGATTIGVSHSLNTLSVEDADVLVSHGVPDLWSESPTL